MTDGVSQPESGGAEGLPASAFPEGVNPQEYINKTLNPAPANINVETPAEKPQRPEGVPEKFWDADKGELRTDALLKSYSELEKTRGNPEATETPAQPDNSPKIERPASETPAKPEAAPEGSESAPAAAPLGDLVSAAAKAYADTGAVTEESYKALTEAGLPREMVDTYFAGLQALEQVSLNSAYTAAGGKETFDAAREWAAQNLSDDDFGFYNNAVANPKTAKSGVEWLVQKFKAAVPDEGKLVTADVQPASLGSVYRSQAELVNAMKDPRYSNDPAYRQEVADKMLRSRQQGALSTGAKFYPASKR